MDDIDDDDEDDDSDIDDDYNPQADVSPSLYVSVRVGGREEDSVVRQCVAGVGVSSVRVGDCGLHWNRKYLRRLNM